MVTTVLEERKTYELQAITTLLNNAKQIQEKITNALKLFNENSKKLNSYPENYIIDNITNETFKGYANDAYLAYQKENTEFQQFFNNSNSETLKKH